MSVLEVLTSQSNTLIRAEVRVAAERSALESGIRQAIEKCGFSIDEVSAASGVTPDEIRALLDKPAPLDDLACLSGEH